ncbi:Uncharacterised protein [Anaerotruncus sp. 2789STDY5834896]|uniref:Uncharacterized protein n=1 Tax=uncultured Anaerotruncus sp. TaxID=905011 RepID=A0A1C6JB71_9FIRM|nr:Uncharacterised protein [uncultured Anaerotruncus sp.]
MQIRPARPQDQAAIAQIIARPFVLFLCRYGQNKMAEIKIIW